MSLAERTRRAVRARPFLLDALRAGVVNHAAAARLLDLDGDPEAVATALRRYAETLDPVEKRSRSVTVRMRSGVGFDAEDDDALLQVGDTAVGPNGGHTAIIATGDVDADALAVVLARLAVEDRSPTAAAVGRETLLVVVERRHGADAVRLVEAALEDTPDLPSGVSSNLR
jgi:hypothetical protein